MKKPVIICSIFLAMLLGVWMKAAAQERTFLQQDRVIGLSIGLGGTLYSGYDSGFSRTPAISLSYEHCVKDNLFDENSALGIGGMLGFASAKYSAPGDSWSWKSTNFILGGRGALHYQFITTWTPIRVSCWDTILYRQNTPGRFPRVHPEEASRGPGTWGDGIISASPRLHSLNWVTGSRF